jgi:outer membrane protein
MFARQSLKKMNASGAQCKRITVGLPWGAQTAVAVACLVSASFVHAQSLAALYEAAKAYDATFLSAQTQFGANQAKAEQARAGLLPSAALTADAFLNNRDSSANALDSSFNNQTLKLAGNQPLYRPGNKISFEQAQKSLEIAQAQLQAAEQDLIVRTAQAYFDVLASEDNLTFVKAQKSAVSEQLAAAKRNFEVGTSTITDTREAQARFDLVNAQEIAAENEARVKKLALAQLVGKADAQPARLVPGTAIPVITPDNVEAWVNQSESTHPAIKQAQAGLEIAQLEVQKAQAAQGPTVDLVGQYQIARAPSGSQAIPGYVRNNVASVGVQFNLPLYTGGAVQNRVKEALLLEEKARTDLDAVKRSLAQATRTAFFGVSSGMGQIKALEAAESSSQSALDANKLGYQVGVRINIDVLNAQSQLYQTKASLAKARYDVLVGGLKLRQAAGALKFNDLPQ